MALSAERRNQGTSQLPRAQRALGNESTERENKMLGDGYGRLEAITKRSSIEMVPLG